MATEAQKEQECPGMEEPREEHRWLQKLVGEWNTEAECSAGPDDPPMKSRGTESVRSIGGLWIVANGTGEVPGGGTANMILTVGYDPKKKRYTGTWIGSMMTHLWVYDGEVEPDGKTLSLYVKGPKMGEQGFIEGEEVMYREQIHFVSDDHRTWTSAMQNDDGSWTTVMTANYHRKK